MSEEPTGVDRAVSRRQVLEGGILLGISALAAGCSSGPRADKNASTTPNLDRYNARNGIEPAPDYLPPIDAHVPSTFVKPRSAWTRSGIAHPVDIDPMGGVRRITVHHDGMPPARLMSESAVKKRIELIRHSHVESRGFADIGYHYVIDPEGRVWEGRSVSAQGAHAGGDRNKHNIGILVLGNFEQQQPKRAAVQSLDAFLAGQMRRHRVPVQRVYTHREIGTTVCPGRNLQAHMDRTRRRTGALTRMLIDDDRQLTLG